MSTSPLKRYSPLWVTIHWLVALLFFTEIYLGLTSVGLCRRRPKRPSCACTCRLGLRCCC